MISPEPPRVTGAQQEPHLPHCIFQVHLNNLPWEVLKPNSVIKFHFILILVKLCEKFTLDKHTFNYPLMFFFKPKNSWHEPSADGNKIILIIPRICTFPRCQIYNEGQTTMKNSATLRLRAIKSRGSAISIISLLPLAFVKLEFAFSLDKSQSPAASLSAPPAQA